VEQQFTGLREKVHRTPENLEMFRSQVDHHAPLIIPFFKKEELIFIRGTLAKVAAIATLFHPDEVGQRNYRL
jgi:hypothetical protein